MIRKSNTTDESILGLIQQTNKYAMEENSNKNAAVASTQRDLIAGEVSRDLTNRLLLPEKYRRRMRKVFFTSMTLIILCSRFLTAVLST